ncbi:unnamed protein product, partial [marine sediment metagenome]
DGVGNDNIIKCSNYDNEEKPAEKPVAKTIAGAKEAKEIEAAYHCPPDCRFSIPLDESPTGGCAVVDELPLAFEYTNDPSLPLCPEYLAPTAGEDTKINLCDTCSLRSQFPTCMDIITFGDAPGKENIIKCAKYEGK